MFRYDYNDELFNWLVTQKKYLQSRTWNILFIFLYTVDKLKEIRVSIVIEC